MNQNPNGIDIDALLKKGAGRSQRGFKKLIAAEMTKFRHRQIAKAGQDPRYMHAAARRRYLAAKANEEGV